MHKRRAKNRLERSDKELTGKERIKELRGRGERMDKRTERKRRKNG